jgi:hypothetical protein
MLLVGVIVIISLLLNHYVFRRDPATIQAERWVHRWINLPFLALVCLALAFSSFWHDGWCWNAAMSLLACASFVAPMFWRRLWVTPDQVSGDRA